MMEKWVLAHPTLGQFEAYVGTRAQIRDIDPGFPARPLSGDSDSSDGIDLTKQVPDAVSERTQKLRDYLNRDEFGEGPRLVLFRDGVVVARLDGIKRGRVPLRRELPSGKASEMATGKPKQHLEFDVAGMSRFVTMIRLRDGDDVVNFDVPQGSPAADRLRQMEESRVKAVLYPILGGIGKSGWAIMALVIGPLVSRFLEWLFSLLPDFDIPWPKINWPTIPWPDINLPDIHFPDIPWPQINWPKVPWPAWEPPGWVEWMLEHPKVWTPLVLAVVWAVASSRKNKKSQRTKAAWEQRQRDMALTDVVRVLHARVKQLEGSPTPAGAPSDLPSNAAGSLRAQLGQSEPTQ